MCRNNSNILPDQIRAGPHGTSPRVQIARRKRCAKFTGTLALSKWNGEMGAPTLMPSNPYGLRWRLDGLRSEGNGNQCTAISVCSRLKIDREAAAAASLSLHKIRSRSGPDYSVRIFFTWIVLVFMFKVPVTFTVLPTYFLGLWRFFR